VFPPNRLLLIFEAREMVLFFFFCCSHPIILHSIVWSMMHGRALKRIDKKKKICVQYRSIVFLSYFFFVFFFVRLSEWQMHTHTQTVFYFLFFSTWDLEHDYHRNIPCFVLILSHGIHQATLDRISVRHYWHLRLMASYIKSATVTSYALHT
jgi:hypothetical protein